MAELNFQLLLLQSSVSHDPLEIFLLCWFDDFQDILIHKKLKRTFVIEILEHYKYLYCQF